MNILWIIRNISNSDKCIPIYGENLSDDRDNGAVHQVFYYTYIANKFRASNAQ